MREKMAVMVIWDLARNTANSLIFTVTLPVVLVWRFILSYFAQGEKKKTWRRVIGDAVFRWVVYTQNMAYLGFLMGPSFRTYKKWCLANYVNPVFDTVGEGEEEARLLWIGSKRPDRVILYLHGGGFYLPMADYSVKFWAYVRDVLRVQEGIDVSVAMLDYTLIPRAQFPSPLRQTVAAVSQIISTGVPAQNIQITGDSAGGNLTLQLILHMLHPVEGVPKLPYGTRFGGAYLMSPWVFLREREGVKSYKENDGWDVIAPASRFTEFGERVIVGVPSEAALPYVDATYAPPNWYEKADLVVDRVLITGGGMECIRDDIIEFGEVFCKAHGEAQVIIDEFGVHDDPLYDFMAGEKKLAKLTPLIIQWFTDGFSKK